MYGNTFGNKRRKIGGGFPVWRRVYSKVLAGGVFSTLPEEGCVIPAGTPVYQKVTGGEAIPVEFYRALNGSTGTTLKVTVGTGLPTPAVGEVLMIVPETLDGTGEGVEVTKVAVDGNVATVTLSKDPGTLSEGKILTVAAEKGDSKKMKATSLTGFTENDAYIEEGTESATCAIVWHGVLFEDRIVPVPDIFKATVPNILFEKEA